MAQQRHKRRVGLVDILIILWVAIGLIVLAYPFASDAWVSYRNQQVIDQYQAYETAKNERALKAQYRRYQARNAEIAAANATPGLSGFNGAVAEHGSGQKTVARDQHKLETATIAQLTIPKIQASLPVFNHTNDYLLQFGSCLLDGSSYPTGGKSTHAVISAHRGVPSAELFTKLPKLKKGDKFYIKIAHKTLAYKVYRREIVTPEDTSHLGVEPGKDIVTLLTCTPYMVNSHRLLVTGERVPYTKADERASRWAALWNKLKLAFWALIAVLGLLLLARMMRGMLIGRSLYTLTLHRPAGTIITARRKSFGKRKAYTLTADADGLATADLPGGRYRVTVAGQEIGRAFVKKWRDLNLTFKAVAHRR